MDDVERLRQAIINSEDCAFTKLLEERKIDPNSITIGGITLLESACNHGRPKIVEALLKNGANLDASYLWAVISDDLLEAWAPNAELEEDYCEVLRVFFDRGLRPNEKHIAHVDSWLNPSIHKLLTDVYHNGWPSGQSGTRQI